MNTIEESIDFNHYLNKRAVSEESGQQFKRLCQSFQFYASLILVIVGKRHLKNISTNLSSSSIARFDRFTTVNQSIFIDENSTKFFQRISNYQ